MSVSWVARVKDIKNNEKSFISTLKYGQNLSLYVIVKKDLGVVLAIIRNA